MAERGDGVHKFFSKIYSLAINEFVFDRIVLALQASCRSQDFCKLAKLVNKNYCSCDSQILLEDLLTLTGANVRFAHFRVQIIKKRIR